MDWARDIWFAKSMPWMVLKLPATVLASDPSLIHRRSSFGHRSTLLHYVGSNGVETYRQRVPMNLAEIAKSGGPRLLGAHATLADICVMPAIVRV